MIATTSRDLRGTVLRVLYTAQPRPDIGLSGTRSKLSEPCSFLLALGMMNCGANACSETLFGSLKVERPDGMRFDTRRRAKREVVD